MRYFSLLFIGISSGALVAAGLFAFIVAIGVVNRVASRTGTSRHLRLYESASIAGGVIFNILYLFADSLPFGHIGLIIFGIFSGLFIGLQAFALAEVRENASAQSTERKRHYDCYA